MTNLEIPLDMLAVSQRASSWRFDLLDQQLVNLGPLEIDRSSPPTMSCDTSRSIKRSMTGFVLTPNVINDVNVIQDRVRVTMVLDNGSTWRQGVFLFSDLSRAVVTAGLEIRTLSLVDQGLIVDQQTDVSISFTPGTLITSAIQSVVATLPVTINVVSNGSVVTPSAEAIAWPAGTSRLRIVNELAAMLGYHELYFDNEGIGQLGPMPDPETAPESEWLNYISGGRVYLGSMTRSTDILEMPNRFVVINNGATEVPITGRYDVPASAAHSAANRGFVVTRVEQMQGISSVAEANAAARALSREWRYAFETVEFSGPPDPRHDTYDIVNLENERFLEMSWSMSLAEGSEMRHVVRRTYEGEDGEA